MGPPVVSRRERLREATRVEIRTTARELLNAQGSAAVTVNAIAREMGVSGPALYRYYASHDELVGAMTADFYRELTATIVAVRDAHAADSASRRLLAMCRAMRSWALDNTPEFGWMFASPIPDSERRRHDSPRRIAGQSFEQIFMAEIVQLWATDPFPVPRLEDLAPSLRDQLRDYSDKVGDPLPPEAVHVFLTCWIRLYGLLCMEVLNQLDFAYTDLTPVFEECLRDIMRVLGLGHEPSAP